MVRWKAATKALGCILVLALCCPAVAEGEGEGFDPSWSAARVWNEAALYGIRHDSARPVVHARNLYSLAVVTWDAWVSYADGPEEPVLHHEKSSATDVSAARTEAISYAAYRLLRSRFANSPGKALSLPYFDSFMAQYGFDINLTETTSNTPAALGNRIAAAAIAHFLSDGANEANNYAATNGYTPINSPLVVSLGGPNNMTDPNRWQPLALDYFVDQSGVHLGAYPAFIGPHWGSVTPFALQPWDKSAPDLWLDPGPPPLLGTTTDAQYKQEMVEVLLLSSQLTPDDGVLIDISPAALGNSPLGTNDGAGHALNPVTNQPYAPNMVKRGDFGRILAEFWADGPNSETPPGHWNVLANYTSDRIASHQIAGVGPVLDRLEWDVKLYLALNGAMHDAAVVAWGIKGYYDSARPISGIRYLCTKGQSSNPELPSYDPEGIPLVEGLIELITAQSSAPGERHEMIRGVNDLGIVTQVPSAFHIGQIAVYAWLGTPVDPVNQYTGVGWQLGTSWVPYQRPTFVTPPFAGYVSGHSTYSRAGAEVLTRFTGSEYFPDGMGVFHAAQNAYLVFEDGPTESIDLQWATYYDAADQSGNSRIWGGIHIRADDFTGRHLGSYVGREAFQWAQQYFAGTVSIHASDTDHDSTIGLSELLRVIQFYNTGAYHCEAGTEDGYGPGTGDVDSAPPYECDYSPQDWAINLSELLRVIQFYNTQSYHHCPDADTEDGFCPGEA